MRNKYSNSKSYIEEFSQIINFNFTSDTSFETSALLDVAASNLSRSSRIGSRRVSSFNSATLLMKSFEFAGMNSSVLRSRGSSSSPAFNDSKITFYVENKFSIKITNLPPIEDCGGEGVSNCQSKVGKDQSRSLNSQVDRGSNQEDKSAKGEIFSAAVFGFKDCGNQHPKTEEISQTTVNSRALGTENNQISTVVNQSAEWRVSHE